jgi:nucleoside 2-deoxyribosyltransferase
MTGYPQYNFPAFTLACTLLRSEGLTIVSPHEKESENDTNKSWADHLKEDIRLLLDCDAIILLAGYPASKGATLELSIALALGLQIFYYTADARGLIRMSQSVQS